MKDIRIRLATLAATVFAMQPLAHASSEVCEIALSRDVRVGDACIRPALDLIGARIAQTQSRWQWPDRAIAIHIFSLDSGTYLSFSLEKRSKPGWRPTSQTWLVQVEQSDSGCRAISAAYDSLEDSLGGGGVSVHN